MDRGSLLGQAANVLVNIVGGNDLTLAEVQAVMEDLSQHIGEQTQLLFGAAVDPKLEGRLGVTLISSLGTRSNGQMTMAFPAVAGAVPTQRVNGALTLAAQATTSSADAVSAAPVSVGSRATSQEFVAPDNAIRGRFDKSEPTIVDGEDLDVPTFMRKNLKMK